MVHVGKYYPPFVGGVEHVTRLLAEGAAATGEFDVHAWVFADGPRSGDELIRGVRVRRFGVQGRVASQPISIPYLRAVLFELDPEIIHLHAPNPLGEIAVAMNPRGSAVIIHDHAPIVRQRSLEVIYRPLRSAVYARANAIVVHEMKYASRAAHLQPHEHKIRRVPIAVDPAQFTNQGVIREAYEKWSRRFDKPYVLFIGRLVPYKGIPYLLKAFTSLEHPLIIVGEGPEKARLQRLAVELGLASRVMFVGELERDELIGCLRASALLALPSISAAEGSGVVVLEAHACGIPTITTEVGTATSVINADGLTGLVVPPCDAGALARALVRLLGDADLRARMGTQAKSRVETEYSAERASHDLLLVYREVMRSQ